MAEHVPTTSRRRLLAAAPAALALSGAVQAAVPQTAPSLYSTWDPETQRCFDDLRAVVEAQANGTYVAPPDPDAELIALCARYVAWMREYCSVGEHTHDMLCSDPEWRRCHDLACAMVPALHAMEAEIADMPANGVRGLLAKAEVARHQLSGDADRDIGPMDPENELVWSLVADLLDVLGSATA